MNPEIRYYLSVFVRRLPLFLLVSLSISSSAIALAVILPTVYTANAVLLVEGAQLDEKMVETTIVIEAREQLQIMQQRLMTRRNLLDIARQYNVFEDLATMSPDQIVEQMRADTTFRSTSGRDQATLLTVFFNGRTSQISAQVANEYVTRILDENKRVRTQLAQEAISFFEQELESKRTEVALQSAKIQNFQNANIGALPDTLSTRLDRMGRLQQSLARVDQQIGLISEQRAQMIRVFEATGGLEGTLATAQTAEQRRLAELRASLAEALSVYTEDSPRVRPLKAQIEMLERQVAEQARVLASDNSEAERTGTILDIELAQLDSQVNLLEAERKRLEEDMLRLEESIRQTPNNRIQLDAMNRDYEIIRRQFERAAANLETAEVTKQIEDESKGERITVIEQAVAPDEPSQPNRPLIAAGGTVFGLGAATFLVVLLEMLNKAIRRPIDITNGLGITPLATVPYIATRGEKARKRLVMVIALAFVLAGLPAVLYVVHYQFMPLDLLMSRIMDKISF